MNIDDSDAFKSVMAGISTLYRQPISAAFTHVWWDQFKGYPFSEFRDAVLGHTRDIEEGRFFPTPAHVFNHLQGNPRKKKKEILERVDLSWIDIKKALKHFGDKSFRHLKDKQAQVAVLEIGGWKHLSGCTANELAILKKEFTTVYERLDDLPLNDLLERIPSNGQKPINSAARTMTMDEQMAAIQGISQNYFPS